MIPEITVSELSEKLKSEDNFILLDVREPDELVAAKLSDSRLEVAPMSRLAREGTQALSDAAKMQDATIYVMCHHGNRSAQVTASAIATRRKSSRGLTRTTPRRGW